MSNPEFTAPDFTTQTAAQYKANLDAAIAANNPVTNLGFSTSAGTFTVHGHEGSALASTNPAFVRFQDPDNFGHNKFISIEANQDFIDDAGASEIIGNLFGHTTGVAVTTEKFYLYAVSNDAMDTVAMMISRQSHRTSSPATAKIGAPDDAVADSIDSFFSLDSLDETLYDTNPCVCVGSFEMSMSTSDDWTVTAIDADDGVGTSADTLSSVVKVDADTSQVSTPLQAYFHGSAGSSSNVTGDGTNYAIVLSEIDDIGSNFSGNTYTAPVDGVYSINYSMYFEGIVAAHTYCRLQITTTPRNYGHYNTLEATSSAFHGLSWGMDVKLDAGDTIAITFLVAGSTKVIDVNEAWMSVRLAG